MVKPYRFNITDFFTEGVDDRYEIFNAMSLFNFYEKNKSDIYRLIAEDRVIETDNNILNKTYYDIFNGKYNREKFCLKLEQTILCDLNHADENRNNKINTYIFDCKRTWQGKSFFSTKYNNFYKYNSNSPYNNLDDETFLLVTNAIHNYFFVKGNDSPTMEVNNEEDINIDEVECGCNKETDLCDNFYKLSVSPIFQQSLHNILYMNGNIKSNSFTPFTNMLYKTDIDKYEQISKNIKTLLGLDIEDEVSLSYFPSVDEHFYFDDNAKTFVVMNKLYITFVLNNDDRNNNRLFIPLYKVLTIYPYDTKQYYYINFFLDNDPPELQRKSSSKNNINSDYYKFLMGRISFYIQLYRQDNTLFKDGYYIGEDYLDYEDNQIKDFETKIYESKKSKKYHANIVPGASLVDNPVVNLYNLGGKKTRRKRRHNKRGFKKSIIARKSSFRRKSVVRRKNIVKRKSIKKHNKRSNIYIY